MQSFVSWSMCIKYSVIYVTILEQAVFAKSFLDHNPKGQVTDKF